MIARHAMFGKENLVVYLNPYGDYISQLIWFAKVTSHVAEFNTGNKISTAKHFKQGCRYYKLLKTFTKFYWRHYDLVSKLYVRLKSLLKQVLSEAEFYGDFLYTFRTYIVERNDFGYI